jgi:micrococcal nuclease
VLRALALLAFWLATAPTAAHAAAMLEATVLRVVDGDTVHVRVGERVEKVRYIGVNTPELHHPRKGEEPGGRAAHAVNRRLLDGKRVRLELDVQSHDRHGRLLAYVWAGETMVNAELVRLGYAQVMTVPPNVRHQALFVRLQREAREARRGLWRQAQAAEKDPSASLAPSAVRSTYRQYASRTALGRRLASGSFCAAWVTG